MSLTFLLSPLSQHHYHFPPLLPASALCMVVLGKCRHVSQFTHRTVSEFWVTTTPCKTRAQQVPLVTLGNTFSFIFPFLDLGHFDKIARRSHLVQFWIVSKKKLNWDQACQEFCPNIFWVRKYKWTGFLALSKFAAMHRGVSKVLVSFFKKEREREKETLFLYFVFDS